MPEAVELVITDAEAVELVLDDPDEVELTIVEEVVTLEVIGEIGPRGLQGIQGIQGDAATIAVGDTTTGAPGSGALVTNTGDTHDAVFDFLIPQGPVGPQGLPGLDTGFYRHNQSAPSSVWTVTHGLGFYPSVSVQDSAGSVVYGDVDYQDANTLTITFQSAFGGYANLS